MVAITVILAAVIGTFVLNIGGSLSESPPSATWETEQAASDLPTAEQIGGKGSETLNITYTGGEEVKHENINATINGEQAWSAEAPEHNNPTVSQVFDQDGPVSITYTQSIVGYGSPPSSNRNNADEVEHALSQGDTLRITWDSGDGQSQILYEYEIKDVA